MTTCGDDIKYQTYLQQVVVPVQFNLPMSLRPMGQEVKQVPPWLAQVTGVGVELGGGIKIVGVFIAGTVDSACSRNCRPDIPGHSRRRTVFCIGGGFQRGINDRTPGICTRVRGIVAVTVSQDCSLAGSR
ncbi:MAG: hypothetical protein UX86_C0018G0004 [Candidatus Amesbacteria bacterium GW2011_GWC1_47_15]|uniref:Uncharacterized protein n=1 Tax=Candidatus Amesbacteria bacterium GW2011_GWC1_47_15 TaxID=1618364 RepID=A0A0G1UCB9_9BACT|nr:MAG: hypothetical protein UX86_C0018G0004 [Candidatus Amesbacteria bacterium GW2011_GWC1_47_15]